MIASNMRVLAGILATTAVALTQSATPDKASVAAAVQFARQYIAMSVPAKDDPDAGARACLEVVDQLRQHSFASLLIGGLQGARATQMHPDVIEKQVAALLAKPDLHGLVRVQLRALRYRLLCSLGRSEDAAANDMAAGAAREFVVAGPFGGADNDFLGAPFAPELLPWPKDSVFDGAARPPRSVRLPVGDSAVSPEDSRDGATGCFYLLHRVRAAQAAQCYAAVACRGPFELFVNGERVAQLAAALGDGRRQFYVPVAFGAGCNHVVIKTCSRTSNSVELYFVDARSQPVPGLQAVAAKEPIATHVAARTAKLEPLVDAAGELQAALQACQGDGREVLHIVVGFMANVYGLREQELAAVEDLHPTDPTLQLAAARLWRRQSLVPEDQRNREARTLEEAAQKQLDDRHFAMLRSSIRLLEEQDKREEAMTRLWQAVAAKRAGPMTFRLLLEVARRAKFGLERPRILARWQKVLPMDPLVYQELAKDARKLGATRQAAAYAEKAVRLRPDSTEGLQLAYWPLLGCGEYQKAAELCEFVMPAALQDPNDGTAKLLWDIGVAAANPDPGRWLQLTDELRKHPRISGSRLRDSADALYRRGHLERAQAAYRAVLERDPDDYVAKRLLQRSLGQPEPGAGFERFRLDGTELLASWQKSDAAKAKAGTPATTLLDQRIVEVFADGSRLEETHELRRLNDPDAVEMYGDAAAASGADEVLLLRTIDGAGNSYVPVKVQDSYSMPRLEPGVFVEWRYRNHVAAPEDQVISVGEFFFGSYADKILRSELVVIRPKDAGLALRMRGIDQPSEVIDLGDGREALRFTVRDVERVVPDTAMPAFAELVPVVVGGSDRTAAAVLRTSDYRLRSFTRPTPPIRREVAKLLEGVTGPKAQLLALHTFCNEEISSARSRSPTETLLKRQGNRNQLLLTMLRTAGFTLQAALTETARAELVEDEGALFQDATRYFTEWCVRVHKGEMAPLWLFYDATRYSPPGWIPPPRSRAVAMVATPSGTEMVHLPANEQRVQHLRMTGAGKLSAERLEVDATIELLGNDTYRAAEHFLRQPAAAQRQFARQFSQSIFQGWQVRSAELLPLKPGGTVQVRAKVRRRGLQVGDERSLLAMPLPKGHVQARFGPRPGRVMPMRHTSDMHMSWDIKLELDGVQLAAVPETLAVHHGSLEYLQEFRLDAGALHIKRRMTMGPATLATTALPAWSKMLERLERAETQSLEFRAR